MDSSLLSVVLGAIKLSNPAEDDALKEHLLGLLGAHVSVRELLRHKHTRELPGVGVSLVNSHLDGPIRDLEHLVGLGKELILALATVSLQTGKSNRHVVAGGATTPLGVKEETRAVRGSAEHAAKLSAHADVLGRELGNELLDVEEEGHTLTTGELHGLGSVVDAHLLLEDEALGARDEGALDAREGVGRARHHLGVNELPLGSPGALLGNILLDLPRLGLEAEVNDLVLLAVIEGDPSGVLPDLGAAVGETSALDLEVGQALDVVGGDGLSGLGTEEEGERQSRGGSRLLNTVSLHGGGAGRRRAELGLGGGERGLEGRRRSHEAKGGDGAHVEHFCFCV
mmetsp:Transcript_1498/g.3222  ORF Transcript_1498/g.3222 Transcript_1498/m.3222 type:complete len:341 (+) Transcript_1498:146-1168(+)